MTVQPAPDKVIEATLRNVSVTQPQKLLNKGTSQNINISSGNIEDSSNISSEAASFEETATSHNTILVQEPLDKKTQKTGENLDYYFENPDISFGHSNYNQSDFTKFKDSLGKLKANENTNISNSDIADLNIYASHLMDAEDPNSPGYDSDGVRKRALQDNISEILNKYGMSSSDVLKQAKTKKVEQPLATDISPLSTKANTTGNINVESKNADYESAEIYNDQFGGTHEKKTMYSQDGDLEYISKKNYNDNISTTTHIENAQTAIVDGTKNEKREEAVASPGEKLKAEVDINKEDENKLHIEGKSHKFESQEMSNDKGDFSQQVRLISEDQKDQTAISTNIVKEKGKTKTDIQDIDTNQNMKNLVTVSDDGVTVTSSNGKVQSSVTVPENDGYVEKAMKEYYKWWYGEQKTSHDSKGNVQIFSDEKGDTNVVTQDGVINAGDADDSYPEKFGQGVDYVKDSAWSGAKSAWDWTKSWFAGSSSK